MYSMKTTSRLLERIRSRMICLTCGNQRRVFAVGLEKVGSVCTTLIQFYRRPLPAR
jgi:hypothetical protein